VPLGCNRGLCRDTPVPDRYYFVRCSCPLGRDCGWLFRSLTPPPSSTTSTLGKNRSAGVRVNAELRNSSSADQEPLMHPDAVLVIIRDVQSYFEDCGCSGTAVGGVARLPGLIRSTDGVTYVFVGDTLFPPVAAELLVEKLPNGRRLNPLGESFLTAGSASMVALQQYGKVLHLPSEREAELVRSCPNLATIAPSLNPDPRVEWLCFKLQVQNERLCLNAVFGTKSFATTVPMPATGDRARQAVVVGVWGNTSLSNRPPRLSASLGGLYAMAGVSEPAAAKVRSIVDEGVTQYETLLSYWTLPIHGGVPEQPDLLQAIRLASLGLAHAPPMGASAGQGDFAKLSPKSDIESTTCYACHRQAIDHWNDTRHSHSMRSLVRLGKAEDPRCTMCHSAGTRVADRAGVSCDACHASGKHPAGICSGCHTSHTDPHARWRAAMTTICQPGVTGQGRCDR